MDRAGRMALPGRFLATVIAQPPSTQPVTSNQQAEGNTKLGDGEIAPGL